MRNIELNDVEKYFIWKMVTLDYGSIENINIPENITNIFKYSIENRIDQELLKVLSFANSKVIDTDLKALREINHIRSIRSLRLLNKAISFGSMLTAEKINYVFLKGVSFHNIEKKYMRAMRDIDVLIDVKDIPKSIKIAKKNGFKFKHNQEYDPQMVLNADGFYGLPAMIDSNDDVLEIHYRILANDKDVSCKLTKSMLLNKKGITYSGNEIYVPPNEENLLHLIYHSSKKGLFDAGISTVMDISKFKKQFKISSERLYSLSKNINMMQLTKKYMEIKNHSELKKIYFFPVINKKISEIHLEIGLLNKVKKIIKKAYAPKNFIKREFGYKDGFFNEFFYRIVRFFRQIKQFAYLILVSFRDTKLIRKRNDLIIDIIEENQ